MNEKLSQVAKNMATIYDFEEPYRLRDDLDSPPKEGQSILEAAYEQMYADFEEAQRRNTLKPYLEGISNSVKQECDEWSNYSKYLAKKVIWQIEAILPNL